MVFLVDPTERASVQNKTKPVYVILFLHIYFFSSRINSDVSRSRHVSIDFSSETPNFFSHTIQLIAS